MQQERDPLEQQHLRQRAAILRVYNYYRISISFAFLFLFLEKYFGEFVGALNPDLFQRTILIYISVNILIGLVSLFVPPGAFAKTGPLFTILILDILALTLMMSASGGVSSGLGNFLIFTCAFGGALIYGRGSTVLPAIAFILTIYVEFYVFFLEKTDFQNFFQAGILGILYFGANIFFQTASQQLRNREQEVFKLEQINQLVIDRMRIGVVVVSNSGMIKLINNAGKHLLVIPAEPDIPGERLPYRLIDKLAEWSDNPTVDPVVFHTQDTSPELIATFSAINTSRQDADTLIFIEDSTEVQRQAQQLKLAALGRLSASIAHEIRNPLGAISHAAQLLGESTELNKGDIRLSEIIQNHCVRMNDVIENVLQMSRRRSAQVKKLGLDEWVTGFVEDFSAGRATKPNIQIKNKTNGMQVEFDPLHLSQVLGNLCQNGLRYSEKKTGVDKLLIEYGRDEASNSAYIAVIDYGDGVGKGLVPNLFEPFYTTETSGTGLGLYLSRELCEANESRLGYSQAPHGGSCFKITFLKKLK
ncbi:MAG: two-component system sensor histidine kinase PilS (NtrC family) [Granulosicoccus sp.]|jgi:two-component system sensor histidine kinase PilS (NtrC family)